MTFPVNFMDHPSSANFPYNYTPTANRGFGRGPRVPQKDVDYTDFKRLYGRDIDQVDAHPPALQFPGRLYGFPYEMSGGDDGHV